MEVKQKKKNPNIISTATPKQKKVAELVIENSIIDKPLNGGEILEKVGYSEGVQKSPRKVLESEGVKMELEIAGFTKENAKAVVSEIMLNEEADNSSRLKATDQVFKVLGGYAPEKKINFNANVNVKNNESLKKLSDKYKEELKETLNNNE